MKALTQYNIKRVSSI